MSCWTKRTKLSNFSMISDLVHGGDLVHETREGQCKRLYNNPFMNLAVKDKEKNNFPSFGKVQEEYWGWEHKEQEG